MLTKDQAVEAAFYSAANLVSLTDAAADNLCWMGVEREDVAEAKAIAARLVRAFEGQPVVPEGIAVRACDAVAAAFGGSAALPWGVVQERIWTIFVVVLQALDAAIMREAASSAVPVRSFAPQPIDPEERIDALIPDPLALISSVPLASAALPPPRKTGRK